MRFASLASEVSAAGFSVAAGHMIALIDRDFARGNVASALEDLRGEQEFQVLVVLAVALADELTLDFVVQSDRNIAMGVVTRIEHTTRTRHQNRGDRQLGQIAHLYSPTSYVVRDCSLMREDDTCHNDARERSETT